eukprot:TRINITY_DN15331_c0_g1_i1.p1 TRINITY_DN15331_c0_g1~~TRINITY_DN15331_c0_g1_i1.p1  ORF type:complete len:101 (-),score=2.02 TRINITY_DN15331_c0_g1_i1:101-403(-)
MCRLLSDPIKADGLQELALVSFGTVYHLGECELVNVTSTIPEESLSSILRELQLWAMTGFDCVRLDRMEQKQENGMVQFAYIMRRYDGDLTQYLPRGKLE